MVYINIIDKRHMVSIKTASDCTLVKFLGASVARIRTSHSIWESIPEPRR